MDKLKFAIYWAAACGGCDVAILDINEKILDVAENVDIVLWPLALDFKYKDVAALPEKSVDVCLFNGAVRNSEQEEIAKLLRAKSKVLVAFGACACFGGIPSLGNVSNREKIFRKVYHDTLSTVNTDTVVPRTTHEVPEGELTLPEFYDVVRSLAQVIPVEYFIPGCPPPVDLILTAVTAILKGELPPAGATIASEKVLCDECERERSEEKTVKQFKRPWEMIPDRGKCFLEQGLVCAGPGTRGGCGARCVNVNMPCRGCFGAPPGVQDQGAKLLAAMASLVASDDPQEIARAVEGIDDPLGTFYRFGLANSTLGRVKS
ncbi:MAG: oxidoreductase [Armatimonadota bacterium]|nr:MAG: oxidoreductase [Armatimonadota bacterium]